MRTSNYCFCVMQVLSELHALTKRLKEGIEKEAEKYSRSDSGSSKGSCRDHGIVAHTRAREGGEVLL